ncbi:permease for cytosine/purines, uracil, thiamine, allantoin-domain-containing protein [Favolaschia claudopus]|uniref:Permease for cytosine/purines, uracil, thiamine, allantoin-domain-containing protein n=1 Tax=Favolaschia claudopus TaxID=2862362 RepID=A0AAW0E3D6_9AGAR
MTTPEKRLTQFLRNWGVETHGIDPIPKDKRTDTRSYQLFLMWFSATTNLSAVVVGAGGPVVFNLSFVASTAVILIVNALWIMIPGYFAIFGPKVGTRCMVYARFSWGPYGVAIPSFLNVIAMMVYLFFNTIIGGQLLAHVSHKLTIDIGIVIIALISLAVSFSGYRVLHWFGAIAWIPSLIGICIMLGVGGKHLTTASESYPAPSASAILSFAATLAGSGVAWCNMTPDYGVYHSPNASSTRIFLYTYLGILLPTLGTEIFGAAFAAAVPSIPSWAAGYDNGNDIGGLTAAVLEPVGGFGKFLLVLMALGMSSQTTPVMYSCGISLMCVSKIFARVPRYIYAIIATGVAIPLAIVGRTRFYNVIVACIDIVGYWSAAFAGVVLTEHLVFRRRDFANYEVEHWDNARKLPSGFAAVLSLFAAMGFVVPCMAQTFYVGPIAKGTGDIGLWIGLFTASAVYCVLRPLEARWFRDRTDSIQEDLSDK